MLLRVLSLMVFGSLVWGCATASRGATEILHVTTQPPGASVSFSTGRQCTSPCDIEVKRRGPLAVTAELGGCVTRTVDVPSKVDRRGALTLAGYGTLLIGGLLYEGTKETASAVGSAIGSTLACTPVLILGADPEDCPKVEAKDKANPWLPVLLAGVPAGVDLATGALNARYPNPLVIELDCGAVSAPGPEPH